MKPPLKVVLVSEFGEELVGYRAHLCEAINELWPRASRTPVLPADVSMCVDLRTGKVKCTRCDEWHLCEDIVAREEETDIIGYVSKNAESPHGTCQWEGLGS